jgi:hypothetical protein
MTIGAISYTDRRGAANALSRWAQNATRNQARPLGELGALKLTGVVRLDYQHGGREAHVTVDGVPVEAAHAGLKHLQENPLGLVRQLEHRVQDLDGLRGRLLTRQQEAAQEGARSARQTVQAHRGPGCRRAQARADRTADARLAGAGRVGPAVAVAVGVDGRRVAGAWHASFATGPQLDAATARSAPQVSRAALKARTAPSALRVSSLGSLLRLSTRATHCPFRIGEQKHGTWTRAARACFQPRKPRGVYRRLLLWRGPLQDLCNHRCADLGEDQVVGPIGRLGPRIAERKARETACESGSIPMRRRCNGSRV